MTRAARHAAISPQFRFEFVASDESLPYHIFVDERLTVKVATQLAVSDYLAAFTDGFHYAIEEFSGE